MRELRGGAELSAEHPARRLWRLLEAVHAVVYFAPEVTDEVAATGLRGWWRGYFAGRAAPLGPVGPEVVTATFANFHPDMVGRALPSVWEAVDPGAVLAARERGLRRALAPAVAAGADVPDHVVGALDEVVAAVDLVGRPLAAAWAGARGRRLQGAGRGDLDRLVELWWAATVLREHRGDGHVAVLADRGLDGCEAHVLLAAVGRVPRTTTQPSRGWGDDDWEGAAGRLRARGLVGPDGSATPAGEALHHDVERRTDELASRPWAVVEGRERAAVEEGLAPVARAVLGTVAVPVPNPMGWAPTPPR